MARVESIGRGLLCVPILLALAFGTPAASGGDGPPRKAWPLRLFARREAPPAAARNRDDLAPAEAARACLATAEELAARGHRREAILLYERARGLDPKLTQVCRPLAVLYDQQGDTVQALAEYKQALAAAPNDADLLNDLGYYYYQRQDYAQSETWLRRAIEASPKHERAQINLGKTLGQQGRYQESFDSFAAIVGPAAAHSNVGMILAQHGRLTESQEALREALRLDPNLTATRHVLAHLERVSQAASQR